MGDISVVKVKRSSGRETETKLLNCHCASIMANEDGSVVLELFPESSRADGLRVYIGPDSAMAAAPSLASWQRMVRNMKRGNHE